MLQGIRFCRARFDSWAACASGGRKLDESVKLWSRRLATYKRPSDGRALFEIAVTLGPFVALWAAMWAALSISIWLTLLLSLPTAAMLLRLFAIQHDCGHGAMFVSKQVNDWVGRALGVLTFTPFDDWRRSHALHHAVSGNLDRRGIGDIDTLTVDEFLARGWFGRAKYWIYRHPLVLFVIGPAYQFVLRHRFPSGDTRGSAMPLLSTVFTNLGIVAISALMIFLVGWKAFLIIQLPVTLLGASAGVWLFYIQHQFEETHWETNDSWERENAALQGSSYYDLPAPLMWVTANIGIHHVHHISSQIPFHVLPKVVRDYPELKQIGRLTFWQSLKCISLTLWDEERRELVSFRQLRKRVAMQAAMA